MAGNIFTNWATKDLAPDLIMAFNEAGKIGDDWYLRTTYNSKTVGYALQAAPTVLQSYDGAVLSDPATTESSADITPDTKPYRGQVYITQAAQDTNEVDLFKGYITDLAQVMRSKFERALVNYMLTTAAATGQTVLFNDDSSYTATDVADAVVGAVTALDILNAPSENRVGLLHPTYLTKLYSNAAFRSGDFISGQDNSRPFTELNIMGVKVRSGSYSFGVDDSSNTDYGDSKYKINNAGGQPNWGCIWHKQALAVNYYGMPTVKVEQLPGQEMAVISARMYVGTSSPRSTCVVRLRGDAGTT